MSEVAEPVLVADAAAFAAITGAGPEAIADLERQLDWGAQILAQNGLDRAAE